MTTSDSAQWASLNAERAAMRRDYERTESALLLQDRFLAQARRVWRGRGTVMAREKRIKQLARTCCRECEVIFATYETTEAGA